MLRICFLVLVITYEKAAALDEEELTLCEIISQTPNYSKFKLHNKANCLAHVKSYENLTCLRNEDNQVNRNKSLRVGLKATLDSGGEKIKKNFKMTS